MKVWLVILHFAHDALFLFVSRSRPLPGFKPTPRDMAHRRWDLPAGSFFNLFFVLWWFPHKWHELWWCVCLERVVRAEKSNKSFKLNDFSIIYPKFCDHHGQLSASRFTTQVLIHFCAFIKVSLTSFSFTWESKQLSDATHMLINHTPKKKEGRENTDGTLLALSMSYFGHVGM